MVPTMIITVSIIVFYNYLCFPSHLEGIQGDDLSEMPFGDMPTKEKANDDMPTKEKAYMTDDDIFADVPDKNIFSKCYKNDYVTMMDKYADILNPTNCYVCAQFPTNVAEQMSYFAILFSGPFSCIFYNELLDASNKARQRSRMNNEKGDSDRTFLSLSCLGRNISDAGRSLVKFYDRIGRKPPTNYSQHIVLTKGQGLKLFIYNCRNVGRLLYVSEQRKKQ